MYSLIDDCTVVWAPELILEGTGMREIIWIDGQYDEENQCGSIRCMSSAALGSATICGVEYGGVYLDYTWPLNYFEQQHCLLSQEACTLATTPKKVGIGGCKLPAEDDRVLAAFKTDVVSMRSSSIQREKQQHTA